MNKATIAAIVAGGFIVLGGATLASAEPNGQGLVRSDVTADAGDTGYAASTQDDTTTTSSFSAYIHTVR